MANYAMVVPSYVGHLNPMAALGRALERRGHQITLLSAWDAAPRVRKAGLRFIPLATSEFPEGEWDQMMARTGELTGRKATRFAVVCLARFARGIYRDLPGLANQEGFDGLVMDQLSVGAESVCQLLGLPLAVACNSFPGHWESRVPPVVFPWRYGTSLPLRARNLIGQLVMNSAGLPLAWELFRFRRIHRLPLPTFRFGDEIPPSLVQVAQAPAFFDFPRRRLPNHFHYTGPWIEPAIAADTAFPWDRLDGRPLIYGSLGTLQNRLEPIYRVIAEACAGLPAQLVLALGRSTSVLPDDLPGAPIVIGYAPQLALLRHARLVITHGGMSTTLESLSEGVPVVAVPITHDQPGVAARIRHLGVGEFIPVKRLTAPKLRQTIVTVLESTHYRERARHCATEIARLNGASRAAELIATALANRERLTCASVRPEAA